ncbi:DUF1795 domain-containing protein [Cohnella mopanensis]|uniref:DUF1795 domain-containing protein n=1 Tax=Cohnella mopanensis TaxID=2911966 RepID=UPI001EF7FE0D|nr:DUF1795 domain-containing protein [Cohnella mopanensis]
MKRNSSRKALKMSVALGLLALALSACGGSKDDKNNASPSASVSPSASASETPSASPSASAEASPSASTEAAAGFKTFKDGTYGTTFQYPEDWTYQENIGGAIVAFLSPRENDSDMFQENINFLIQDLGGQKVKLADYVDATKQQLGALITGFKLEDEGASSEDGVEAYNLLYSGKQGEYNLKWQQSFAIIEGKAYVITYTAEEGSFDKFVDQAGSIAESWDY